MHEPTRITYLAELQRLLDVLHSSRFVVLELEQEALSPNVEHTVAVAAEKLTTLIDHTKRLQAMLGKPIAPAAGTVTDGHLPR